jgi:hypothetical protein
MCLIYITVYSISIQLYMPLASYYLKLFLSTHSNTYFINLNIDISDYTFLFMSFLIRWIIYNYEMII